MRTNKYFVAGIFMQSTFNIQHPKQVKNFNCCFTISNIADDTPPEAIMQTLRDLSAKHVTEAAKGNIAAQEIQFGTISLLDSFEQTTEVIEIPQEHQPA